LSHPVGSEDECRPAYLTLGINVTAAPEMISNIPTNAVKNIVWNSACAWG